MSTRTVYFPRTIKSRGKWREWMPQLGHFIGNDACATKDAAELRKAHPEWTVRRFNGHVNVYI